MYFCILFRCFFGVILLLRTPFGRALTSRLIEPLVLRLPASERWRSCAAGMGAGVVPPAVDDFFGLIRLPRLTAR